MDLVTLPLTKNTRTCRSGLRVDAGLTIWVSTQSCRPLPHSCIFPQRRCGNLGGDKYRVRFPGAFEVAIDADYICGHEFVIGDTPIRREFVIRLEVVAVAD